MSTEGPTPSAQFWEEKSLTAMTPEEWESLCDGCGRCCLVLLEDDDTEQIHETDVCCHLFDPVARRCTRYAARHQLVPDCVAVTPEAIKTLSWMPDSCAYRRLAEGRGLAEWHPLVSGRQESVAEAGVAVSPNLTSERAVATEELWRFVTGRRT